MLFGLCAKLTTLVRKAICFADKAFNTIHMKDLRKIHLTLILSPCGEETGSPLPLAGSRVRETAFSPKGQGEGNPHFNP
jgi:hypothetical protein